MSGAAALLSELRSQGKTIAVVGTNLRIVPKVTDTALIDRLRAHKAELIELLKGGVSQYTLDYKAEIPAASTAQALAHDLVKLCTQYGLNLHAAPEGIFLEVLAGDWQEVMSAMEEAGYRHVV